jgi:hypothetical protein
MKFLTNGLRESPVYRVTEGCADILTSDRTPHKVTIEPMVYYTNVDIFREKGAQSFSKKVWEPLNLMEKWVLKKRVCALDRTTDVKTSMMLVTDFK